MDNNMSLYRQEIDRIDDELVRLFGERMAVAGKIAEAKRANNMPVLDVRREREKLADVQSKADAEFESYVGVLYSLLFELSRSYQEKRLDSENELYRSIENAISASTNKEFPKKSVIACQGVEGSYSQIACDKMFGSANIMFFDSSTRYSRQSTRDCAATAYCPSKTARRARSTRYTIL